jgi:hypothetical protein
LVSQVCYLIFCKEYFRSGGRLAGAAEWVLRKPNTVKASFRNFKGIFITTHKREKLNLFSRYAGRKIARLRAAKKKREVKL